MGRYEILEHLGTGGMASVYLAKLKCTRGFDKLLAVKLLHRDLAADRTFVEMFVHEARVVAQLQHSNIVQVLELGEWRGTLFLAMELLLGETLCELSRHVAAVEDRPLDPRIVCGLGMQACEALHYSHEATDANGQPLSLVHLDVSPQNLLLTYSGSLKLIDFGIARSAELDDTVKSNPFRAKYSYTSPERLLDAEPDCRSDIFSLGTVLWELLSGRRLFSGDNELQTMYRVSQAAIPSLNAEREEVPVSLDYVIAKSLARNPDRRYQSALELLEDLYKVRKSLGPPVTTHELADQMTRWFPGEERRRRTAAARFVEERAA